MKILLTGSAGRIGQAIHARLLREHSVVTFDRSPTSMTQVVADITDRSAVARALEGVDAVVHTAALHAPHVGHVPEAEFMRVNVEGTRLLAEACIAAGVRRMVFTSTTALYGDASVHKDRAGWVDESTEPLPRTIYHRSKLVAESLLREVAESGRLNVTVLRMSRCLPEPAPAMAVYRLHRGIDARDVAAAHECALDGSGYRLFVISGATPFLPDDAALLKRDAAAALALRAPALVRTFHERGWTLPRTIDRVYCAAKAQRELGWSPRHGFEEVLRQLDEGSPEVLPPLAGEGEIS